MKKLIAQARTTETADTATRLLHLFGTEKALKDEDYLKPLFAEMEKVTARMTQAIGQDKVLSDLDDADATRDEILTSIFKIVEGYAAMPVETLRLPAERVNVVLQKFGQGVTRQPYAVQSSLIEALLKDLEATDVAKDLAELQGLEQSVNKLREAQTNFTAKRVNYEKALGTEKDSASDLKKPLQQLINVRLLPYLETMKMVSADKYAAFADTVAKLVAETNTGIQGRRKTNKSPENPPTA